MSDAKKAGEELNNLEELSEWGDTKKNDVFGHIHMDKNDVIYDIDENGEEVENFSESVVVWFSHRAGKRFLSTSAQLPAKDFLLFADAVIKAKQELETYYNEIRQGKRLSPTRLYDKWMEEEEESQGENI